MDIMLQGVYNFINFIINNWTMISTIIVGIAYIYMKLKKIFVMSKDEQLEIIKTQINEIILRLVTEAECDYAEWIKCGEIKRAQVIAEIFAMYPSLSKLGDQAKIIEWLDETIDNALKTMRKIFETNTNKTE